MQLRTPVVFVSHGSPMVALEFDDMTQGWAAAAQTWPRPKAIVFISAHWITRNVSAVMSAAVPGIEYDFGGFDDRLFQLTYPAPGNPALAQQIETMLSAAGFPAKLDAQQKFDHGAWIPLRVLYPQADISVLQVSIPWGLPLEKYIAMAEALRPLRDQGVLLIASGNITHNLSDLDFANKQAAVAPWAKEFDAWVWDCLLRRDAEALINFQTIAPHAAHAHPSIDHFIPLFYALGFSHPQDQLTNLYEGFHYGTLSMRAFVFA